MAKACGSRPTSWAARWIVWSARRARISPRMWWARWRRWRWLDGDVLNAAAALKNFTALKGRGARFEAGGIAGDRRKLQRQSRLDGGGAGAAGRQRRAARSRCWATCWRWARAASPIMPAWPRPSPPTGADLVFAAGAQMKALWDALPASRRGAYAENSAELAPHADSRR